MSENRKMSPLAKWCNILASVLLIINLTGCAGPIGVTMVSPQNSYKLSTENAIGEGKISDSTKTVLQRYNALKSFTADPLKTIQTLHDISKSDDRRDLLFALAELSYLEGENLSAGYSPAGREQAPDLFLQSAVSAYFFLLGEGREAPPTAYDKRFREACDLYNRALWRAFPANANMSLNLAGGERHLPVGNISLVLKTNTLAWGYDNLEALLPVDAYAVRGFTVRNRTPGMGLALIGLTRKSREAPNGGALPITAFLRMSGDIREYQGGNAKAYLELYSALDTAAVQVNGRSVPLETDISTPLAYKLEEIKAWNIGVKRFLTGAGIPVRVLLIQPYEPGRIPVVFVHGTASSPVWWAEMFNSLRADPEIRKRFQFWFYQYNSSNMMALSAAELREALTGMVQQLDPRKQDPAMQKLVVIGHSQGGLLTKMTVADPGERLWNALSDTSIDEMDLDQEMENLVRRLVVFEPLPFVQRVVYISTPHRGSYLTKDWVRFFTRKVISMPVDLMAKGPGLLTSVTSKLKLPQTVRGKIPTSIDGMSADNPLLRSLLTVPLNPGVTAHSIISVKPGMDIATGNDGVVEYKSAHVDGVESEFIVRSPHSCQSHPYTIEEVRRILLRHIGINNAWQAPAEKIPTLP